MSDAGKAVFLSYASQDAEAAKRIADALRSAAVEVWFDQSELVGGDAWDHKIRKQIKECALLIPIISAATQARTEGYFRLELRLADQRTHLMAKGRPFLLPVVIDATRDSEAHVPESFTEVQWTRLPGGETPPAFCQRVKKLLASEVTVTRPAMEVSRRAGGSRSKWWWALPIFGMTMTIALLLRPPAKDPAPATPPPVNRPAAAPFSETQKLVAQARALLDDDPFMTRANVLLADQLSQEAIAKDPNNAEAYAAAAWVDFRLISENYEDTPQRRTAMRTYAEKARLLAPDSVNAELAMCGLLRLNGGRTEAIRRLAALSARGPESLTVLREWAWAEAWGVAADWNSAAGAKEPDSLIKLRALSPLGRAYADSIRASRFWVSGHYVEADRVLDGIFASGQPVRLTYLNRMLILTYGWGDLPAARDFVATIPAKLLMEDVFITHETFLWYYRGDYDKALAALDRTQREMLQEALIHVPTALMRGMVLGAANRPGAAEIQWREALRLVDKLLKDDPGSAQLHGDRSYLLAALGDRAGADKEFALAAEIDHKAPGSIEWGRDYEYFVQVGNLDEAIPRLDRVLVRDYGRWPNIYTHLRYDPRNAALRKDPRVQPILERAAQWLAEMKAGSSASSQLPSASHPPEAGAKSVAVLPFENRSAGGEDSVFLADGIHEDLINTLSRVPGLKVMSRTAVQRFHGAETPMSEIVAALKVSHVVEAGVQRAGNQVRINVQLVQTADGQTVWSERYDRVLTADGIFALQEEITAAIAKALKLQLDPGRGEVLVTGTTKNLAAYEAFLKGRQTWTARSNSGADLEAIAQFQRAVELDPNFALAYGAMAEAYITLGNGGQVAPAKAFPLAKEAAERALAIDPRCVQALTARGEYAMHYEWDYAKSERLLRQALVVDPNYANAYGWLAGHLKMMNRAAEAKALDQRKAELEPERPLARRMNELEALLTEKNFPAAVATARQIASQVAGNFIGSYILGDTLRKAGQGQEAVQVLEKAAGEHPDELRLLEVLGMTYAELGQLDKARGVLARMTAIQETRFVFPLYFVPVAAAMNDRDLAFSEIERAFQVHDPFLPAIGADDDFAPIKTDPRFREVLKRLKLDAYFPETAKP